MKKSFPNEVYLNGKWVSHDKAFVSVFDRGYMLGDGIYEVIPIYEGKPFALEGHLSRFQNSLNAVEIEFNVEELRGLITDSIQRSAFQTSDAAVYIQITRGVAPRTHFFPENVKPSILLYAYQIALKGFEDKRASVIVSEDVRWHRCDIKSTSLMANVRANNEAHKRAMAENLLVRNGHVTEGSHTSVFFVKDNIVYTHPEGNYILPGVTRKVVIELCEEIGLDLKEEAIRVTDIVMMDEVFLTGTTAQVTAVTSVNIEGKEVYKTANPGTVTRSLQKAFIERVTSEINK